MMLAKRDNNIALRTTTAWYIPRLILPSVVALNFLVGKGNSWSRHRHCPNQWWL
jgi:hypothetical protein